MKTVGVIPFLLLLFATITRAQSDPADTTGQLIDTTNIRHEVRIDTLMFQPVRDTSAIVQVDNPADYERRLTQNPTIALFKSMFVPGWGQFGNRKYIKAAVIAGLESWFIGAVIHYGRQAADYRDRWENTPVDNLTSRRIYYEKFEDRRDERNKYAWFAGLTIFVSMFDAYVDAHLSGSPAVRRDDHLSFEMIPDIRGGASAQLTYTF